MLKKAAADPKKKPFACGWLCHTPRTYGGLLLDKYRRPR
jgi:hypothetical protein